MREMRRKSNLPTRKPGEMKRFEIGREDTVLRFYKEGQEFHDMNYQEIIRFHGHECPGLAIGYRMAVAGMKELDSVRSEDEEIVAIVENNACGVDALQCVSGCTFGKGNLIFRDYGKHVYTLYSRKTRRGVRVVFQGENIPGEMRADRMTMAQWILDAPADRFLSITRVSIDEPEPARIMKSEPCFVCGEATMESRLRDVDGKRMCVPCSESIHR